MRLLWKTWISLQTVAFTVHYHWSILFSSLACMHRNSRFSQLRRRATSPLDIKVPNTRDFSDLVVASTRSSFPSAARWAHSRELLRHETSSGHVSTCCRAALGNAPNNFPITDPFSPSTLQSIAARTAVWWQQAAAVRPNSFHKCSM
jgi:hypothetical protein